MRARSSMPFCPYDGRQAGLLYLPACWRYTTAVFHRRSQWLPRKPLVVFVPLQDHYAFRILLHPLMQGEPHKWEGHLQPRWGPPLSVTLAAAALPLTYSVIPRLLWLTRETPSLPRMPHSRPVFF